MATPPKPANSTSSSNVRSVNVSKLPRHIAVIMDGNNRWAKLPPNIGSSGHRAGAATARNLTNLCSQRNVEYLTLFVFSSENWQRPQKEINGLMALFLNVLKRKEVNKLHKQNIKVSFIGDRSNFTKQLQTLMKGAEELTLNNTGLNVIVAADYGGQWDIGNAVKIIAQKVAKGEIDPELVNKETVEQYIALGGIPMPDLCIRTGGENRISNFLLWQFAYTELYFTDVLWPDFDEKEFDLALEEYTQRQRRFGMVSEQVENF